MAVYNLTNYTTADGLGFPLNFRRGNPNPLDNSSVWKSMAEAKEYAANDPTAYVGQPITIVDFQDDATTATMYIINNEKGDLVPVGSTSSEAASADHLKRVIVTSIDDIDMEEDGALNYIYMVPRTDSSAENHYDEYMIVEISGEYKVEKVGDWSIDLTDYAKKTDLPQKVSELENDSNYITENYVADLISRIKTLEDAYASLIERIEALEGQSSSGTEPIVGTARVGYAKVQ